jgi:hypothetical protein
MHTDNCTSHIRLMIKRFRFDAQSHVSLMLCSTLVGLCTLCIPKYLNVLKTTPLNKCLMVPKQHRYDDDALHMIGSKTHRTSESIQSCLSLHLWSTFTFTGSSSSFIRKLQSPSLHGIPDIPFASSTCLSTAAAAAAAAAVLSDTATETTTKCGRRI